MNNSFDQVWGSSDDLLMNRDAIDLQGNVFGDIYDQRLSEYGIPMYWATVVYFKKTPFAKTFFDTVEYVRDEYNFFQFLYGFKKSFYRNDFAYSIAAHILSGCIKGGIHHFPESKILSSYQQDAIADVINESEIVFMSNDPKEPWKDTLVKISNMNVHIMNKRELLRVSDKLIKSCMEKL